MADHRLFGRPIEWAGVGRGTLLTRLNKLGWVDSNRLLPGKAGASDDEIRTALTAYQVFHGLENTDGYLDEATIASINATRYCGLSDRMAMTTNLARWGKKDLKWCFQVPNWPIIGTQAAIAAYAQAFQFWADVADIHPSQTNDPNSADIIVTVGAIDGPYGVLAYSQLPGPGTMSKLSMLFDEAEPWTVSNPTPQNQIDIVRVFAHELGHNLGLSHLPGSNLMAPIYSPSISHPQNQDLTEIRSRYGPSLASTAPVPAPSPVAQQPTSQPGATIVVGIEVAGTITRLSIPGWTATRNS